MLLLPCEMTMPFQALLISKKSRQWKTCENVSHNTLLYRPSRRLQNSNEVTQARRSVPIYSASLDSWNLLAAFFLASGNMDLTGTCDIRFERKGNDFFSCLGDINVLAAATQFFRFFGSHPDLSMCLENSQVRTFPFLMNGALKLRPRITSISFWRTRFSKA